MSGQIGQGLIRSRGGLVLLLLCGTLLAYFAGIDAFANITRSKNPALALRFDPQQPTALAARANAILVGAQDPASLRSAEKMARRALHQQAINPVALRVMGFVADARKAPAQPWFVLADTASRRDMLTNLWLIEAAVKRNDVKAVINHYDAALRTSNDSAKILFPVLSQAAAQPEVAVALADKLKYNPPWFGAFIQHVAADTKTPALPVVQSIERAGGLPRDIPNRELLARYLTDKLMGDGNPIDARRWFLRNNPAQAGLLTEAGFTAASVSDRYGFMAWRVLGNDDVGGSWSSAGNNRAVLQATAEENARAVVVAKTMFLMPGRYRLSFSATEADFLPESSIRWELACLRGRDLEIVWQGADFSTIKQAGRQTDLLTVPANCAAQSLRLLFAGGRGTTPSPDSSDVVIGSPSLVAEQP